MDGWIDRQIDRWMGTWIDGWWWMDRQQVDKWINGKIINRGVCHFTGGRST